MNWVLGSRGGLKIHNGVCHHHEILDHNVTSRSWLVESWWPHDGLIITKQRTSEQMKNLFLRMLHKLN
jgi:hypothetical protein